MTVFNSGKSAARYAYFDDEWRTKVFRCPDCGWSGSYEEMDGPNLFNELFDCACKNCDKMLLIVAYPTRQQTIEAAALGNKEAQRELARREAV